MMYTTDMLRINIYIPGDLNRKLDIVAKTKHQTKAETVRQALEEGLKAVAPKSSTAQSLLKLAKMAEQIPTRGKVPKDFVQNLDYYTWGGEKRE